MSFANVDCKVRGDFGNSFPHRTDTRLGSAHFASEISRALKTEFGPTGSAIKAIIHLTNVNQRTARNWYEGRNAPSGELLAILCRHSNKVLETFLTRAGRQDLITASKLIETRGKLLEILATLGELERQTLTLPETERTRPGQTE